MNPKTGGSKTAGSLSEIRTIQGHLDASGKKFALVISRFNELISNKLKEGALDCLLRHGATVENISIVCRKVISDNSQEAHLTWMK